MGDERTRAADADEGEAHGDVDAGTEAADSGTGGSRKRKQTHGARKKGGGEKVPALVKQGGRAAVVVGGGAMVAAAAGSSLLEYQVQAVLRDAHVDLAAVRQRGKGVVAGVDGAVEKLRETLRAMPEGEQVAAGAALPYVEAVMGAEGPVTAGAALPYVEALVGAEGPQRRVTLDAALLPYVEALVGGGGLESPVRSPTPPCTVPHCPTSLQVAVGCWWGRRAWQQAPNHTAPHRSAIRGGAGGGGGLEGPVTADAALPYVEALVGAEGVRSLAFTFHRPSHVHVVGSFAHCTAHAHSHPASHTHAGGAGGDGGESGEGGAAGVGSVTRPCTHVDVAVEMPQAWFQDVLQRMDVWKHRYFGPSYHAGVASTALCCCHRHPISPSPSLSFPATCFWEKDMLNHHCLASYACFREKDILNHRYFARRALYLATLARHLVQCNWVIAVEWSTLRDDVCKPILLIIPRACKSWPLRLLPCLSPATFPARKLAPSRNNVRQAASAGGSAKPGPHCRWVCQATSALQVGLPSQVRTAGGSAKPRPHCRWVCQATSALQVGLPSHVRTAGAGEGLPYCRGRGRGFHTAGGGGGASILPGAGEAAPYCRGGGGASILPGAGEGLPYWPGAGEGLPYCRGRGRGFHTAGGGGGASILPGAGEGLPYCRGRGRGFHTAGGGGGASILPGAGEGLPYCRGRGRGFHTAGGGGGASILPGAGEGLPYCGGGGGFHTAGGGGGASILPGAGEGLPYCRGRGRGFHTAGGGGGASILPGILPGAGEGLPYCRGYCRGRGRGFHTAGDTAGGGGGASILPGAGEGLPYLLTHSRHYCHFFPTKYHALFPSHPTHGMTGGELMATPRYNMGVLEDGTHTAAHHLVSHAINLVPALPHALVLLKCTCHEAVAHTPLLRSHCTAAHHLVSHATELVPALPHALVLLKVWARQRYGTKRHMAPADWLNGFQLSLLAAHLASPHNPHRRVMPAMSAFQIFRCVIDAMVMCGA
ncbi:unnamed protein product [Closterium sp. NIES-64]|nr:unnamed protein product [Closterium sp. NIES-64]